MSAKFMASLYHTTRYCHQKNKMTTEQKHLRPPPPPKRGQILKNLLKTGKTIIAFSEIAKTKVERQVI